MAFQPVPSHTSIRGNSYRTARKSVAAGLEGHLCYLQLNLPTSEIYLFFIIHMMNIRKALGDKRKRLLLIPAILLTCCCLCGVISMAIYSASSPSFELDVPSTNNVTVNDSKINIKLGCIKIDKVSLDGNLLSSDAKYEICSKGKTYDLKEGENTFEFKGIDEKGESRPEYIIKLNINYEKKVEEPKQDPIVETPAHEEPKVTEEKPQEPAPKQYKTVEEWEDVTTVSGSRYDKRLILYYLW